MNAGAMGGWMLDVVESVRFATLDGNVIEASSAELEVGYRHCRELKTAIALDAVLKSTAIGQSETALREAIDVYQSKRKEQAPNPPFFYFHEALDKHADAHDARARRSRRRRPL